MGIVEKKLKEQRKHQEWESPTVERAPPRAKMTEHTKKNNVTLLQDIVGVLMIMEKKSKEQRKHQEWKNPTVEHAQQNEQTPKPSLERSFLRAKMTEHTKKNN